MASGSDASSCEEKPRGKRCRSMENQPLGYRRSARLKVKNSNKRSVLICSDEDNESMDRSGMEGNKGKTLRRRTNDKEEEIKNTIDPTDQDVALQFFDEKKACLNQLKSGMESLDQMGAALEEAAYMVQHVMHDFQNSRNQLEVFWHAVMSSKKT